MNEVVQLVRFQFYGYDVTTIVLLAFNIGFFVSLLVFNSIRQCRDRRS